jgi:hypothetical protein
MDTQYIEQLEKIGNAFYAVASEQHVKPLEIPELKLLISRDWETSASNAGNRALSQEAHYILVTMDDLQGNNVTSTAAFQDFESYFLAHPKRFSNDARTRILSTARSIVDIFQADNALPNRNLANLANLFRIAATTISA